VIASRDYRLFWLCLNIDSFLFSGLYMMEKNFTEVIGGIQRDVHGNIIGAKAILHNFFGVMNTTQAMFDTHSITDAIGVYVSKMGVQKRLLYWAWAGPWGVH
jgi:hypothetical protein